MTTKIDLMQDYKIYEMLHESLNAIPIGVTIADINGAIIYTNTAEATMHGYAVRELIGKDARIFAPLHLWKRLDFEETYKIGEWKRETVNVKKNGELFFVHLTSIAVKDKTGVPIGIITACEDITKHKRLEDEHKKRLKELEEFYDLAVGMEVRMRQLKEENEELKEALKKYKKS
jgi:two-component system, NtrC family, sensor kinase